jgi:hypothetical protein
MRGGAAAARLVHTHEGRGFESPPRNQTTRFGLVHRDGGLFCKEIVRVQFPTGPPKYGRLAERLKAAVLKTEGPKGSVGSNPTSSAKFLLAFQIWVA